MLPQRTQRHEQGAELLAFGNPHTPVEHRVGRKAVELSNSPIAQVKDCQAGSPNTPSNTPGLLRVPCNRLMTVA